jgi:outer membrane protein
MEDKMKLFSKVVKNCLVGFGVVYLFFGVHKAEAAKGGIGIIDLQVALNTSDPGKKAMDLLKKKMDYEYEEIKRKEDELKKLEDLLNRQGMLMKESEKQEKEEEFANKRKGLERAKEDIREKLMRDEREMTQKIIKEIVAVARKIGQEEGYDLIMEKGQGVIYSVDTINVTEKVIKRYNSNK